MKQCYETKKFIIPEPISKIAPVEQKVVKFSKEENDVNLHRCQKKKFYDQKICRHLCSTTLVLTTTRTNPISPCETICFELTRSFDSAGEICPFQKYCPAGCPCPYYECEKIELPQKFIPVFDLQEAENSLTSTQSPSTQSTTSQSTSTQSTSTQFSSTQTTSTQSSSPEIETVDFDVNIKWITARWEHHQLVEYQKYPLALHDFTGSGNDGPRIRAPPSFFAYVSSRFLKIS